LKGIDGFGRTMCDLARTEACSLGFLRVRKSALWVCPAQVLAAIYALTEIVQAQLEASLDRIAG